MISPNPAVSPRGIRPRVRFFLTLACISACAFSTANAQREQQGKSAVEVKLTAKKLVAEDGRESFRAAEQAKPGDAIQYDAVYRNVSGGAVKNLLATVPIPQGLAFIPDSAKPAGAQASLDGVAFAPIPLMREVTAADGSKQKQPVPPTEYRALRWTISELAPGASATVSARARVLSK